MERRLVGLDGMRGMAALIVVLHHFCPSLHINLFSHGYLAVDFFFMLSGYVLSRTYDERLRSGMTPAKFMRIRFRRLYPMMALGILAGAALALHDWAPAVVLNLLFAQLLFIPILADAVPLFPLDGVQWSLALELIGNFLHARFFKSWRWQPLAMVVAASVALLAWASFRNGSLAVGDTAPNLLGGPPRLLFSYGVGCLLYRAVRQGTMNNLRFHPSLLALLPTAMILAGLAGKIWAAWLVDLVTVALLIPPIVLIGAHVELGGIWARIAREGGLISYPLYALHLPIVCAMALFVEAPLVRYPLGMAVAVLGSWVAAKLLGPQPAKRNNLPESLELGTGPARHSERLTTTGYLSRPLT